MNDRVYASIITIGDELMIGQVVDTNSAWIAEQLNQLGIWVRRRLAVGDDPAEMERALDEEIRHSRLLLLTGGLGPTADDITKPFLCKYFNTRLVRNPEVLAHITRLFEEVLRRPLTERNLAQADIPEAATILHNARGTAPGMLFEREGRLIISLPGVPYEMKGIMETQVLPLVGKKLMAGKILHRTLLTAGIGESYLADHIAGWEQNLPAHIRLAYLPRHGMVRLRLTAFGEEAESLDRELSGQFEQLKLLVAQWLVTDEDITLPQLVSKMLKARGRTVSTAESCTGGYIAHLLTREAGASDRFNGTVVSYANQVKMDLLGVSGKTLQTDGAVSEATVIQMVRGALDAMKSDYAIATSGIMGPDGGSYAKPVGTVWMAAGSRDHIITRLHQFRYDRLRNIEITAHQALDLLRVFMLTGERSG